MMVSRAVPSSCKRFCSVQEEELQQGRIALNGRQADEHTVVPSSGHIRHRFHMHERPVSAESIRVLHVSDELLVINKPAGVPVL